MARPDVYIGLVGAAGTDLEPVKKQLRAQFAAIGYEHEEIKVSRLISDFAKVDLSTEPEDIRIRYLMAAGDKIRETAKNGDGVVSLIVREIRRLRGEESDSEENVGLKGSTLFIIDSLKNPSEIAALDSCYARNYYTISVYSRQDERKLRLASRIAQGKKQSLSEEHKQTAQNIMSEDQGRKPVKLSQDVVGTFPRADFFVQSEGDVAAQLKRFVELIFGNPFITPTQDEHFMNLARTASLRSADLSRQVGAVIVGDRGEVISQGYNEVPYPGGGVYFEGRANATDNRDFKSGDRDPNQAEIREVLKDLISNLAPEHLSTEGKSPDEFTYDLLHGELSHLTADSRIRSLIEFGRVVQAEMNAICAAARFGRSIDSATLYCTTFPCHGCARHIIASGVREVVFIEPYPKSLTQTLYKQEIKTDDNAVSYDGAVVFRPFQGVSPILFRRVFNFKPRKNSDGSVKDWNGADAKPLRAVERVLHYQRETALWERFSQIQESFEAPEIADFVQADSSV